MAIFESKVIPLESLLKGQSVDFGKVAEDAKKYPAHFMLELFSVAMMLVGAYVVCSWVYELGRAVGLGVG